ncbi:MAG: FHA domain-containing protein [Nitrospirae bacterium]|nr:FHA domain-containing protein [Nitrospirota bacterium]
MRKCLRTNGGEIVLLGSRTTIGRDGENEIQLIDERVSKQHAQILLEEDGRFVLFDLSSRNGTYVKGERIHRLPLEIGTTFQILDFEFTFDEIDENDPAVHAIEEPIKLLSGPATRKTVTASFRLDPDEPQASDRGPAAGKSPSSSSGRGGDRR